jgi:hypothetical protein
VVSPGWADLDRGLFSISVAAELAGLHPQTLRIYEREGLLDPARSAGGTRRYSRRDIDRLAEICALTAGGKYLRAAWAGTGAQFAGDPRPHLVHSALPRGHPQDSRRRSHPQPSASAARGGRQNEAITEPATATPRVPPSSQVVSFTADPAPAFSGKTAPMMASVAGLVVRAAGSPPAARRSRSRCPPPAGRSGTGPDRVRRRRR